MTKRDPAASTIEEKSQRRIDPEAFEQTYLRHEFSEVVRLGLALGRWMRRIYHRRPVRVLQSNGEGPAIGPTAEA